MLTQELFTLNPAENNLLNDGVVEVGTQRDENGLKITRHELRTFVCEGEYEAGLVRILSTYLKYLDSPKQPAVWVSGFFGSGKSHLVKMLGYLWDNFTFPNGDTARSIANLPASVTDLLVELDLKAKHTGKFSVIGTLKDFPAPDVRYSFLQLLLKSLNLPPKFHHFRFYHWLWENGILESVKTYLADRNKDLNKEIGNLFVSTPLAQAVLFAKPDIARDEVELRQNFRANFAQSEGISRDQFLDAIAQMLVPMKFNGQIPLTCIVLDEIQQFIGNDGDKSIEVQNLAQDVCSSFNGRFLLIGTGQNALTDTRELQRLKDRFTVNVPLSDTDVETVTRKTVLAKKAQHIHLIESLLDAKLGEISRLLNGTVYGYETSDRKVLAADFPLLPSTRKFWKKTLQVIDTAGTAGLLRSQLRIVDLSLKKVAGQPVGTIVPADFIFEQKLQQLVQNALITNEFFNKIQGWKAAGGDAELDARILSVIFLIDLLPREAGKGIPSNADTVTDLLIDDLNADLDRFRERVKARIDDLIGRVELMRVGHEVKLQTREGAEWEKDFQTKRRYIQDSDPEKLHELRAEKMLEFFHEKTRNIVILQGAQARQKREFQLWNKQENPPTDSALNVWIKDGWNDSEALTREAIQEAGIDTPLCYVFVRKSLDAELRSAMLQHLAAKAVIDARGGAPSGNPEAEQAWKAMRTRADLALNQVRELIQKICSEASVFLAGGALIEAGNLRDNIEAALKAVADRQFPEFAKADAANWGTALTSAQRGDPQCLTKVQFNGEPKDHPVGQEILRFVKGSGTKGSEIRKHFMNSPYGWSQDAVDTLLIALVNSGHISCPEPGLTPAKINGAVFKKEIHTLSALQKISLRKLFTEARLDPKPDQELATAKLFLQKLKELAAAAGGEPPRPVPVSTRLLDDLQRLEGNELLLAMLDAEKELRENFSTWGLVSATISRRMPQWELLRDLSYTLEEVPGSEQLRQEIDAVRTNRLLLAEPDKVEPLLNDTVKCLNAELRFAQQEYNAAYDMLMADLQSNEYFKKCTPEQKNQLLVKHRLTTKPEVKEHSATELRFLFRSQTLESWHTRAKALEVQFRQAVDEAVQLQEPKAATVSAPRRTLKGKADVDQYLNELRVELEKALETSNVVIIQ
jgi:uncharacterized protein YecT (DUF1311 family)